MTSRTRTAKKTAEPTAPPAKRTTAKKSTAKRAPARKRTPRKPAADIPALTLVKPNDATTKATDKATQVDTRPRLTVRRKLFTGPMGPTEQAAIRAALDSARLALPIPVRTWNGSQAHLADGTLLIHNPGPDRLFTAHIACPNGAIHGWPITNATDLKEARAVTRICTAPHAEPVPDPDGIETELDWHTGITRGVAPVPQPKPPAVHHLREGIRRAEATKHDTQPLPLDQIADGLEQRAAERADTEQTQEIPR